MRLKDFEDLLRKMLSRPTRSLSDEEVLAVAEGRLQMPEDADEESRAKVEIVRQAAAAGSHEPAPLHVLALQAAGRLMKVIASSFEFVPAPMPATRNSATSSQLHVGSVEGITVSASPSEDGLHLSLEDEDGEEISVEIYRDGSLYQKATRLSVFDAVLESGFSYSLKVNRASDTIRLSLVITDPQKE